MTAKQQVNFEDQVLGLFSGTKTRRKIIARTVRVHSAGVKNWTRSCVHFLNLILLSRKKWLLSALCFGQICWAHFPAQKMGPKPGFRARGPFSGHQNGVTCLEQKWIALSQKTRPASEPKRCPNGGPKFRVKIWVGQALRAQCVQGFLVLFFGPNSGLDFWHQDLFHFGHPPEPLGDLTALLGTHPKADLEDMGLRTLGVI